LLHLVGLAPGVGSATAKVFLLLRCFRDVNFLPVYLKVMKPLTQLLVSGLILMTLTGIIWLVLGYGFNNLLIVKLFFVGAVWVVGIYIDNVTEPRFKKLASAGGQERTVAFLQIQKKHLVFEIIGA
jgi:ABC-type transport system involved in cytochrome bd biosynthesis fused ATPase/permease subunit